MDFHLILWMTMALSSAFNLYTRLSSREAQHTWQCNVSSVFDGAILFGAVANIVLILWK